VWNTLDGVKYIHIVFLMELRSNKTKLIKVLKAAGVYEDDMEIEEMRQVAMAMELSAESTEAVESCDLERALLVSGQ